MKKWSTYQKCEAGFTIIFMLLSSFGVCKNNISLITYSIIMFVLCLSGLLYDCLKEEIKELKNE